MKSFSLRHLPECKQRQCAGLDAMKHGYNGVAINGYRQKARQLLNSKEGLMHRSRKPIEPEAVFGQTKANKQYNRFIHFGEDKAKMDFAILAIAFNIGKMYNKTPNTPKKSKKSTFLIKNTSIFVFLSQKYSELKILGDYSNKIAA